MSNLDFPFLIQINPVIKNSIIVINSTLIPSIPLNKDKSSILKITTAKKKTKNNTPVLNKADKK